MDFVDRMSSFVGGPSTSQQQRNRVSLDSLLKFTDLSPAVQIHLQRVYMTLAVAIGIAALGVWFNMTTGMGDFLGFIGFLICVPWLMSTAPLPANYNKRAALLGGAAFSEGLVIGPLVGAVASIHPGVVLTAFLGTSAIFACFSGAALLSKRRSYLYLGGVLSSVLSAFMMMRLGTWFFGGSAMLFEAELYLGGLVFIGYVLFDTQLIVEKAEQLGDRDNIRAALDLFVDFVGLFVRLLIILARNAENKHRDSQDDRRRKSSSSRNMRTTRVR